MTEQQITDLADEALNLACLHIQNRMGQTDGGVAGMFFTDEHLAMFRDYIKIELAYKD